MFTTTFKRLRASTHRTLRATVSAGLALAAALLAAPAAHASDAFYDGAGWRPPRPGSEGGVVLGTEPMSFAVDPLQISPMAITATRIAYTSRPRSDDSLTAVTGTLLVPKAGWVGVGARPLIAYAPGTQGMADRCAPSRLQSSSFEYESLFISQLLARGYAVAMTDYQGLGPTSTGPHWYMNRVAQGHAVLDIARAALAMPENGLTPTTRVALVGYSQGGGAAAAAAEMAASYAPELKIVGASIGAPPADLAAVARANDGGLMTAVVLYGTAGLASAYGIDLTPGLTDLGRQVFAELQDECIYDLGKHAFRDTSKLNANGQKLSQLQQQVPFAALIEAQRLGKVRPAMPVQVNHSLLDDVIPYAVGRDMARGWCQQGAKVRMNPTAGAGHLLGMLDHTSATMAFLEARFAGWPMASSCGWF